MNNENEYWHFWRWDTQFESVHPEQHEKCRASVRSRLQLHSSITEANIFPGGLTDMKQRTVNLGRIWTALWGRMPLNPSCKTILMYRETTGEGLGRNVQEPGQRSVWNAPVWLHSLWYHTNTHTDLKKQLLALSWGRTTNNHNPGSTVQTPHSYSDALRPGSWAPELMILTG